MIYKWIYFPAGYMTDNLSLACNRPGVTWERKHPPPLPRALKLDALQKWLNIPSSPIVPTLCAPVLRPEGHPWVSQAQLELNQAQPRALPVGWQWFEVPAAEVMKQRSSISSHSWLKAVIFKKHNFFLLAGKSKSSSSCNAKQAHKDDLG